MNTASDAPRTFFTADLHAHHANIIRYCHRPFSNVDEMNAALIERWNATVDEGDIVYVIGDFVFGNGKIGDENIRTFRRQLNGRIRMILGNHDGAAKRNPHLFEWSANQATVTVHDPEVEGGSQHIVLNHYAMRVWDRSHRGAYSLYGHSHGRLEEPVFGLSLDVGVDAWDYTPVPYTLVQERMRIKINRRDLSKNP